MEKAKIIIVDNDLTTSLERRASLEDEGYEVVASTGIAKDAIEQAKQHRPDVILMDIKLDGAMDGFEAADIIKQQFEIPIIMVTAYADEYKLEKLKTISPFGLLLKPVQRKDLRVTIEMVLHFAEMEAERKQHKKVQDQRIDELTEANNNLVTQMTELKSQIEDLTDR